MGGTDAGVAPTLKTPIMVWRAVTIRLSGDRVRPVCGLCGFVCLSQASHWSHHPRPLHPAVRRPRAEPRPGRVPRELACRPRSQQHNSATAPVSITHHHHRSLARVIARSNEPPAEPGPHAAAGRRAPQPQAGAGALVRGQRRTRGHTPSHAPHPQCVARRRRGAACRARAACGRGAASPPAPARSRSARPRPTTQCVTYLHHMPPLAGAQRRPGERRPAGPHAARCGTALQPVLGLKTGIGARGCVAHTPCNRNNTIPHRYKLLDVSPPESPGAGPARACGTSRAPRRRHRTLQTSLRYRNVLQKTRGRSVR